MNKVKKVAKIISENEIVLNFGLLNGASFNDEYEIYVESGEDILDPETKESLGKLRYVKAVVTPTVIEDKYCVCRNAYANTDIINVAKSISNQLSGDRSLNVNTLEISGGYEDIKNKKICVGDLVKKKQNR